MKNFTTTHLSTNLTMYPIWELSILECCIYTFSVMSGLPTHSYIIWIVVTGINGVASEFLNLNLSVCGILFSVNSLLNLCIKWFPFISFKAIAYFLFGFTITCHPLFQCLICVDRYLAVVHPVTFLKYKPLRYRVICSVIAWTAIFAYCGVVTLLALILFFELLFVFILAQLILFLSIQLFCCVAVLRALKQSGPGERRREREEENHMKTRAFYLIVITTVSMVITYFPFTVTIFLFVMKEINIQILWSVSYICFMLADLVTPVLFLHRTGKLFCLCSPRKQQL